jgi:hypothetical protein
LAFMAIASFFSAASLTAIQIGRAASQVEDSAREIRQGTADAFRRFNAATDEWRESSRKTIAYADWILVNGNHTLKEVRGAVQDFRMVLKNTDENLNGKAGVLPAATLAIQQTETISREASSALAAARSTIEAASADLHGTAASMESALVGARHAADEASKAIEQMRVIAEGPIAESAKNVERGTLAAAETLENTQKITERWSRPPRLIWSVLTSISSFAYRTFLKP